MLTLKKFISESEWFEVWGVSWYACTIYVGMCASETSVAWNPSITFSSEFGTMILSQN